jgi:tRNA (cmo5U34)-methyltransferase
MTEIEKQFNRIAGEYDSNRRRFIPCFDAYYAGATDFIATNIRKPSRILDLGAGTGLLTSFWYKKFPDAKFVLVDVADEMLNVARRRFAGLENFTYMTMDYSRGLPAEKFDCIVSALSIHHLEHPQKQALFAEIRDQLTAGGLFVNYDQFSAGSAELDRWYDSYWEADLAKSGLTHADLEKWRERKKLDRECSVEDELLMLRKCGFVTVKTIFSERKFAVIMAKD